MGGKRWHVRIQPTIWKSSWSPSNLLIVGGDTCSNTFGKISFFIYVLCNAFFDKTECSALKKTWVWRKANKRAWKYEVWHWLPPPKWTFADSIPMRAPFLPLAPTVRIRRFWQKRGITNYRQISAHVIQADTLTTTWISLPTSSSRYRRTWKTSAKRPSHRSIVQGESNRRCRFFFFVGVLFCQTDAIGKQVKNQLCISISVS